MARFKIFWSIAAISISSVVAMMLIDPESPFSQNETITSMQDNVNKNIKNKFKTTYNSTLNKYGQGGTIVPCEMAKTFEKVQGITQCGKNIDPED